MKIENHASILEKSKLVIQDGCMPLRYVLRVCDGTLVEPKEYVTHMETFDLVVKDGEPTFVSRGFSQGHYFRVLGQYPSAEEAFKAARADLVERIKKM